MYAARMPPGMDADTMTVTYYSPYVRIDGPFYPFKPSAVALNS